MSDRVNELVNRFLDGELKGKELQDFEDLMKSDENKKLFQAYSALDKSSRKSPSDSLPSNFTSTIMLNIHRNVKAKNEDKKFFLVIISVFALLMLLLIGFLISQLFNNDVSGSSTLVKDTIYYIKDTVEYLRYIFPKQSISILGAFISFGILITAWFFVDFRNKKI